MNNLGHLAIGILTASILLLLGHFIGNWYPELFNLSMTTIRNFVWIKYLALFVGITYIYSLVLDCDHALSKITWLFVGTSIIGILIGYFLIPNVMYYSVGLLIFTFISAQFFPHRGFIHSIPFCILSAVPIFFIFNIQYALLAMVCSYSHLVADEEPFKFW